MVKNACQPGLDACGASLSLLGLFLSDLTVFVQDDIMYCNMTVEENLLFSARYRLPISYTHSQHVYYVERAIQACLHM